ncbi:yippee-domain-containing protein [Conidiobolus coronatus NRRL 28638]|uniref:Protein yippee-like n=1 Tax=Conidiobolus coronatus (strain ATCC 28846 / CBS 209.66 / NRRL 28638) TaxID=796925 RepID=A0A137NTP1_CONC2|nr:yippee-domain-containing protein [Conidiobolus coronatus NRRL 28638]|eukprot:KXN66112.1 yippee-domain-containing protein [Conidiobolus coronatus NRRL 28638]
MTLSSFSNISSNKPSLVYLTNNTDKYQQNGILICNNCQTHLTPLKQIISKNFQGRSGKAYLLNHCYNVTEDKIEDRHLLTGLHTVCDLICKGCNLKLGWKYIKTYNPSQQYKEGKFAIEKRCLANWYPEFEA